MEISSNSHSIEFIAPADVKPRERAWRKYPPAQIEEAMRQLSAAGGVVEPPLLDSDNCVVCGGAIVRAAQKLGLSSIPVLRVSSMSPEELRLYAINAHKLAEMGQYDETLLAEEIRELERLLGEDKLKTMAIVEGELTRLLGLGAEVNETPMAPPIDRDSSMPITRFGDLWLLGKHRLLCASSLESESFKRVMDGELAQFGFTDAPYNLPMRTISSNPDREEFAFGHGEMSPHGTVRISVCERA